MPRRVFMRAARCSPWRRSRSGRSRCASTPMPASSRTRDCAPSAPITRRARTCRVAGLRAPTASRSCASATISPSMSAMPARRAAAASAACKTAFSAITPRSRSPISAASNTSASPPCGGTSACHTCMRSYGSARVASDVVPGVGGAQDLLAGARQREHAQVDGQLAAPVERIGNAPVEHGNARRLQCRACRASRRAVHEPIGPAPTTATS